MCLNLLKWLTLRLFSSRYEGFSLTAVEGMASGKPVIASDVSALHTIVKVLGFLFKAGDEKQLAYEIGKLL
jgi:glycosyltransferase involved in cell wall biosynthesis